MRERIIGVEQEYNLNFIPGPGDEPIVSSELAAIAVRTAHEMFSALGSRSHFCTNGGKLYCDRGHPEFATPECRSVREALRYDKAGDLLMSRTAEILESNLKSEGACGTVFVAKNNVDGQGTTFGSHENYLVERKTKVIPEPQEFFNYVGRVLVPFLVSRTIISGSGHIHGSFQVSQRASFIDCATSLDTVDSKPIINTRDEPHADASRYRRLHLILGDANMSELATLLKLGTTSLVLSMAEDVFLDSLPQLADPVSSLKSISEDPTLKVTVPLTDGRSVTALEIQRWYLHAARRYFDRPDSDEEEILEQWSEVLSELERQPRLTVGKLDWTTKKDLLEKRITPFRGWDSDVLRALDFEYHSLRDESSVYACLAAGGLVKRLLQPEEVESALNTPPPFTRARTRAEAIRKGAILKDWTEFGTQRGASIRIDDPFEWTSVDVLLRMGMTAHAVFDWLADGCDRGSVEVRTQAVAALSRLGLEAPASDGLGLKIRARLLSAIIDTDSRIRFAAVNAMSALGCGIYDGPLRQAADDLDYRVRFAAMNALSEV